jgi:beta-lactamase superfamily II metal-dependent hydrolase
MVTGAFYPVPSYRASSCPFVAEMSVPVPTLPPGKQVLVDGGPSETVLLSQLGRQMPFWDRTLDVVVLTHPDADHITGLVPVLERYQVDTVIFRALEHKAEVYEYWLQLLEAEGAEVYQGQAGLHLSTCAPWANSTTTSGFHR